MSSAPALTAVKAYLESEGVTSHDDAAIASALTAETHAQARVVKAGALLEPDVVEALHRRVARNLAMRNLPLAVQQSDMGGMRLGSNDPEVRRLESPHRKVLTG